MTQDNLINIVHYCALVGAAFFWFRAALLFLSRVRLNRREFSVTIPDDKILYGTLCYVVYYFTAL